MKHINESIIGKKGSSPISGARQLLQGDIIYVGFYPDTPFMVIRDNNLYEKLLTPRALSRYDCSKGVMFRYEDKSAPPNFMVISDYDRNLKCTDVPMWDIIEVRRGNIELFFPEVKDVLQESNLRELAKGFKLVFKDGRWL